MNPPHVQNYTHPADNITGYAYLELYMAQLLVKQPSNCIQVSTFCSLDRNKLCRTIIYALFRPSSNIPALLLPSSILISILTRMHAHRQRACVYEPFEEKGVSLTYANAHTLSRTQLTASLLIVECNFIQNTLRSALHASVQASTLHQRHIKQTNLINIRTYSLLPAWEVHSFAVLYVL